MKGKLILDVLFHLTFNINEAFKHGFSSSSSFDSVDKNTLGQKPKLICDHNNAHDWFHSYLSHRKQFISLCGTKSDLKNIKYGM